VTEREIRREALNLSLLGLGCAAAIIIPLATLAIMLAPK